MEDYKSYLQKLLKTEKVKEDPLQKSVINKLKSETIPKKTVVENKENILSNNKQNLDSIITFIVLKKLITSFTQTNAYKLNLINASGKVIKIPQTEEEKNSLTILDRLIFKIKRLLGSKLLNLNKFFYLKTLNIDFYQKLMVKGNIEQRAEIIRINKDITNLQEKYNLPLEDLLSIYIKEELEATNEI